MKKKTRYKSAGLNFLVSFLCLSVCAISLYFFFKDLNSSTSRTDKDAVATISFKYRIAQRKYGDRVVWERLQQNSPLYDGDTIRTADLAQARISFNNGASIDLNENTMLQIKLSKDGEVKLSVDGGHIEVDTTNSSNDMVLEMGEGLVVNLESGSKLSAKTDDSNTGVGLNITAGNASLKVEKEGATTGVAEPVKLSVGDAVKLSDTGKITKAPITVTSVSENQRILVFEKEKNKASVSLEWFALEDPSEKVIVQTSKSKDFAKIKNSYTAKDSNKVVIPADDGALYWRVFRENDEKNSTSGKLVFENISQVISTYPEKNKKFNYYNEKPKINFSWKGNNYSTKYKVEVARNENIENPIIMREVTGQSFSSADFDDGTYYWRVTPYYTANGIGYYGETETRTFTVSRREQILPPTITIPIDGKKFVYTDESFEADFSWKAENVDSEYTITISRDRIFTDIILEEKTKTKSYHATLPVSKFKDGHYYWKVTQKAKVGDFEDENLVSLSQRFEVAKFVPEQNKLLYPEDSYSVERNNLSALSFVWKISKANEELYANEKNKLQFSTSSDFSNIVLEKDVQGTSFKNVSLKEGLYYWRITKGLSTTEPRTIYVLQKLEVPKILSPTYDSRILFSGAEEKNITVTWKEVAGADFYTLKILDAETKAIKKEISEITSPKITFPIENVALKESKYLVEVQAFASETRYTSLRKSEVGESDFYVRLARPVRLVLPANDEKLDGLDALKNGVTLKWTSGGDLYTNATLNLWRVGTGGKLSLVETYKNPHETLNIPRLTEGIYRWTVNASNKDGIVLDAANSRDFEILPVPLLEKADLESPAKNFKIDAAYLKKNRSITFKWKDVKDATDYDFILYQKLPGGNLKQIYSSEKQKSTSIKFKELKILDVGNFQWQVIAHNRAKDGFVYQNGKPAIQEFKIDFSLPKKIETIDPGVMYGE